MTSQRPMYTKQIDVSVLKLEFFKGKVKFWCQQKYTNAWRYRFKRALLVLQKIWSLVLRKVSHPPRRHSDLWNLLYAMKDAKFQSMMDAVYSLKS